MPRSTRKVADSPEARALDSVRREFDRVEARLEQLREDLKKAAVVAVRAKVMTGAEAARRAGYSREYVSRLVTEAVEAESTVSSS
jgi:CRP-like cAMP-binding protein